MVEEFNIICTNDKKYRFSIHEVESWNFDFKPDVLRIDFKDYSFIEFYKNNIIAVECNSKKSFTDNKQWINDYSQGYDTAKEEISAYILDAKDKCPLKTGYDNGYRCAMLDVLDHIERM